MFQFLKQRMKGVQNISQITKAMELVAATKMRRSQEIALRSRPYSYVTLDLLRTLATLETTDDTPPLLRKREIQRTAIVLVTSDKGLAGAFNSSVLRRCDAFLNTTGKSNRTNGTYSFIAVGKKANAHLEKQKVPILQAFTRAGDFTTPEQVKPISDILETEYTQGHIDRTIAFSTHFRTALTQEVFEREILPIRAASITKLINEIVPERGRFSELRNEARTEGTITTPAHTLLEPSAKEVLSTLASHLLHMEMYQLFMEANASEHAARRMAMKNASENAAELVQTLTITYNKLRQAAITKEITEITAGAEALRSN